MPQHGYYDNETEGRNIRLRNRGGLSVCAFGSIAMLYRAYKPAPPLSDFVEYFWLYNSSAPPQLKDRILPSGTLELVINLRDDELRTDNAAQAACYRCFNGVDALMGRSSPEPMAGSL
jgi:hypothetical protein